CPDSSANAELSAETPYRAMASISPRPRLALRPHHSAPRCRAGGRRHGTRWRCCRFRRFRWRSGEMELHQLLDECCPIAQQEILEGGRYRRQALGAIVHQVPVQHCREALHVEHDEVARLEIEANGVRREECDAKTRHDRLLDRLGAADLHRDVEPRELLAEHLAHGVPRVRALLALYEALVVERRARDLP